MARCLTTSRTTARSSRDHFRVQIAEQVLSVERSPTGVWLADGSGGDSSLPVTATLPPGPAQFCRDRGPGHAHHRVDLPGGRNADRAGSKIAFLRLH